MRKINVDAKFYRDILDKWMPILSYLSYLGRFPILDYDNVLNVWNFYIILRIKFCI